MKYLVAVISLMLSCYSAFTQTENNNAVSDIQSKPFRTNCYSYHKEKPTLVVLTNEAGRQKIFRAGRRRLRRISTENIETITILTAENAVAQYGRGRNGVILITMKTT